MPDAVDDAVDESDIKAFPQNFTRDIGDRVDDVAVIDLVDTPFILEYLWQFPERRFAEQGYADTYAAKCQQDREAGEQAFGRDLVCIVCDVFGRSRDLGTMNIPRALRLKITPTVPMVNNIPDNAR